MSGGTFNYSQFGIEKIADEIEEYLNGYELSDDDVKEIFSPYYCGWYEEEDKAYIKKHHRTPPNKYGYKKEVVAEFRKGLRILRQAYVYAQRIDWLMACDDGEDSFLARLKEDLEELKRNKYHKQDE